MDELKKYLQEHKSRLNLDEPSSAVWSRIEQRIKPNAAKYRRVHYIRWVVAACFITLAGIGSWYLLGDKQSTDIANSSIAKIATIIDSKPDSIPTIVVPNKTDTILINNQIAKNIEPAIIASNSFTEKASVNSNKSNTLKKATPIANDPTYTNLLNNVESTFTQVINLQKARISTFPMYAESADYFKDFNIQINQMEKEEKNIKSTISRRGISNDLLDQLINLYQQKLTILKQLQLEMNKTNNRFKQNRGPVDTTRSYFLSI